MVSFAKKNIAINMNLTYFTTYVRKSLIVCVKLKRPDRRLPSAKRICIDVVGCDASTFNFSFALKIFIQFGLEHSVISSIIIWIHEWNMHLQFFIFFGLAGTLRCWSDRCWTIIYVWRWANQISKQYVRLNFHINLHWSFAFTCQECDLFLRMVLFWKICNLHVDDLPC